MTCAARWLPPSRVVVEVRRGGTHARLGHAHVVASRDLRAYVAPDEGRADLYLRLDRLVVDELELRAAPGVDTEPSAADVAATRRNMLDAVLEAERVEVSGRMTLDQTTFGIAPFTALGGALRVLDRVDVRFRIHADRDDSRRAD